jgi:hypothetical protein
MSYIDTHAQSNSIAHLQKLNFAAVNFIMRQQGSTKFPLRQHVKKEVADILVIRNLYARCQGRS